MNPNICQPPLSSAEIRELLVKRIDQQKQALGIVVGVVEPAGRRVVAYGSLAKDDPRTVDGATIFEIGSITKVFTSLLLADLVHRNEVALDDPAAKYLPDPVAMPERSGKAITLLDLATHRSGLPNLPANLKPKDPRNPYAGYSVDDLYQFLSGYELPRDPGSGFEYSNLGAGLLGHLLAHRAGTDYEALIATRITHPLGMPDTGITLSASMKHHMATGHNAILLPVANWDLPTLAGAGALRSSVNDLLTFLEAFLDYKETPLAPAMRAIPGFGWNRLGESAWHNGGTGGFRSFAGFDPIARTGVVVLSNAFTPNGVDDLAGHIWNPNVPLANPEPPAQRTAIQLDPQVLDRYTGRYRVAPDRILEITRDGGRLFAQVFAQAIVGPRFEVFAESAERFFVPETGSQITFETGPDGRIASLIMHRAGREATPAPRIS
jgi:CubicO group peptidase (beta-lactamase class C family)